MEPDKSQVPLLIPRVVPEIGPARVTRPAPPLLDRAPPLGKTRGELIVTQLLPFWTMELADEVIVSVPLLSV